VSNFYSRDEPGAPRATEEALKAAIDEGPAVIDFAQIPVTNENGMMTGRPAGIRPKDQAWMVAAGYSEFPKDEPSDIKDLPVPPPIRVNLTKPVIDPTRFRPINWAGDDTLQDAMDDLAWQEAVNYDNSITRCKYGCRFRCRCAQ
jgi:hypothetical protein